MALRAASSIQSYTGPDGCSHARPATVTDDGLQVAHDEWVLSCGPCEASLAGHELWGPADQPAPLTVDEIRLRDAQQADATRNVWAGLAAMPEALAQLAMQNQATMQIVLAALQAGAIPGLPELPAGVLAPPAATSAPPGAPSVPAAVSVPPPPAAPKPPAAKKTTAPRAPRTTARAQG
jgi:hypothetical protein